MVSQTPAKRFYMRVRIPSPLPNFRKKKMPYTTASVSYSAKDGFVLNVDQRSTFRDLVEEAVGYLCHWTGHHFCQSLYCRVADWADRKSVNKWSTSIDRATADTLAYDLDSWSWLDDED